MTTLITQQGIPAVEFPIAPPPPRYPVVAKWDAGRIVPHEPRLEPWMIDDVVVIGETVWLVTDEGVRRRGRDITAEYEAMQLAAVAETEYDAGPAGQ